MVVTVVPTLILMPLLVSRHELAGAVAPLSLTVTAAGGVCDQFGMTSSTAVCESVDPVTVAVASDIPPLLVNDGVTVTGSRLTTQSRTPTALVFHRFGLLAR